jgi:ABC-type nitrate/sulfonate/bicarbonate transport system substrate-binding protein
LFGAQWDSSTAGKEEPIVKLKESNQMSTNSALQEHVASRPDTLWYTRCPVPSASGIAIRQGWLNEAFATDGIDVVSLRHSHDRQVRESHFGHTQPNSFRQGGNAPAIYARSEGQDTVLIGLSWVDQYEAILTLPNSGIRTVRDLRGRRLALPTRLNDQIDFWRSISLEGYFNALNAEGLGEKEVELVEIPINATYMNGGDAPSASGPLFTPEMLVGIHTPEAIALIRGEVDAIFAYSVWGVALRTQLGAHEVVNLNRHPDLQLRINNGQPKTLTVSGELARDYPELVARYVAQLVRAAQWGRQNPDLARRIISLELGTAEYWLDEGTSPTVALELDLSLDEKLVKALEVRKDFLLRHGFIKRNFSIPDWIDRRPLELAQDLVAYGRI